MPVLCEIKLLSLISYLAYRFNTTGYDPNTVCEYHFLVKNTTIVNITFNKIHLEDEWDGIVSTNFSHCKNATRRKHKDYIELKIKSETGESNVFCGRPFGKVHRVVNGKDLPIRANGERELVITFWSNSSKSGKGFTGHLVQQGQPSKEPRHVDAST